MEYNHTSDHPFGKNQKSTTLIQFEDSAAVTMLVTDSKVCMALQTYAVAVLNYNPTQSLGSSHLHSFGPPKHRTSENQVDY
jgi:hypothetical protein